MIIHEDATPEALQGLQRLKSNFFQDIMHLLLGCAEMLKKYNIENNIVLL